MRENRTYGLMREGRREPVLYSTLDFAVNNKAKLTEFGLKINESDPLIPFDPLIPLILFP